MIWYDIKYTAPSVYIYFSEFKGTVKINLMLMYITWLKLIRKPLYLADSKTWGFLLPSPWRPARSKSPSLWWMWLLKFPFAVRTYSRGALRGHWCSCPHREPPTTLPWQHPCVQLTCNIPTGSQVLILLLYVHCQIDAWASTLHKYLHAHGPFKY